MNNRIPAPSRRCGLSGGELFTVAQRSSCIDFVSRSSRERQAGDVIQYYLDKLNKEASAQ